MRKLSYIFLVVASTFFVACNMNDENEGRFDSANPNTGWVQYEDGSPMQFLDGTIETIELDVLLMAPVNKTGVEVSYTITDIEGNSSTILPVRSGTVDIAKGESSASLVLDLEGVGRTLTSDAIFDVKLTSTDKSEVAVGLSDNSKPTVVRVKICAFHVNTNYIGNAVVPPTVPTGTPADGYAGEQFNVTLVPVVDTDNQFYVDSAWGPQFIFGLTGQNVDRRYPAVITVNDDATVSVAAAPGFSTAWYPGGVGTYDPCTDTFKFKLNQGVFPTLPFKVDVTYTPAP